MDGIQHDARRLRDKDGSFLPAARRQWVTFGMIAIGLAAAALNWDLPILRNALLYAQIHSNLDQAGMRLWQVCSEPDLVFDKACGFPALAAPFIALLGVEGGLKVASALGAALLVLACGAFLSHFSHRVGVSERWFGIQMAVACLNPLVMYQFWSAYPDGMFFAAAIFSIVLLDRLLTTQLSDEVSLAGAYAGVFLFALFVKPWGLSLFPVHAVYVWAHRAELRRWWRTRRSAVASGAAAIAIPLAFVILAKFNLNPYMNLGGNRGQYDHPVPYFESFVQFVIFLAITVGPMALLILFVRLERTTFALIASGLVYAHIFMVYMGATYNARYYVPVLPIIALAATSVLSQAATAVRRTFVWAFAGFAVASTMSFNERTTYTKLAAVVPRRWLAEMGYLDCLRMGAHLEVGRALAGVNAALPPRAKVYYVSSYYEGGASSVYQRVGRLRGDLRIAYITDESSARRGENAYLFLAPPGQDTPESDLQGLAPRLYRLP